jgi:hypothetical protein
MRFKQAGFLTKLVIVVLLIYMATSLLDLRGQIRDAEQTRAALEEQVKQKQLENQQLLGRTEAGCTKVFGHPESEAGGKRRRGFLRVL